MNGLAQITISGEPILLKFGMPAVRQISEKSTQYQFVAGDQWTEIAVAHILYAGYVNGCVMKDLPSTLSFESFYNLVENIDDEVVKQEIISAIRSFEDSKYVKDSLVKKKAGTISRNETSTGTL